MSTLPEELQSHRFRGHQLLNQKLNQKMDQGHRLRGHQDGASQGQAGLMSTLPEEQDLIPLWR